MQQLKEHDIIEGLPAAPNSIIDVGHNPKTGEVVYLSRTRKGIRIDGNWQKGTLGKHWNTRSIVDIQRILSLEERLDFALRREDALLATIRELKGEAND